MTTTTTIVGRMLQPQYSVRSRFPGSQQLVRRGGQTGRQQQRHHLLLLGPSSSSSSSSSYSSSLRVVTTARSSACSRRLCKHGGMPAVVGPPFLGWMPSRLSSSSSSEPPKRPGSSAIPELVKFGFLLIPVVLYGAYVLQFGPSAEETEAKVKKLYAKEIQEQEDLYQYQKNVIAQAVYNPQGLDSTVTELLQGGRFGNNISDKSKLYQTELPILKEQEEKEKQRQQKQQEEDDVDEKPKKIKGKKKKKKKAQEEDEDVGKENEKNP